MSNFTYKIEKELVTLSTTAKGWKKQLNLVSWNGLPAKYDLREWDSTHSKMGKGVTLSEAELRALYTTLKEMFEGEVIIQEDSLSEKVSYWEEHAPLFIQELKNCVQYMKSTEIPYEQMKVILLGDNQENIDESILNEVESLDSIYHIAFEEFKTVLKNADAESLSILL
ncbi:YdbC family protein [Ectobacillus antri]|uniref:YdbC family protein n=1 Tax=Ectobacillus antri TaxID=2486280 RepID=UPI003F6BFA80